VILLHLMQGVALFMWLLVSERMTTSSVSNRRSSLRIIRLFPLTREGSSQKRYLLIKICISKMQIN
jgi:hypothetical protein